MSAFLLGIGLVLCIEGLIFALLPQRLEDLLAALQQIPLETRRMLGLVALAAGVGLVWWAKSLGA